MAVEGARRRKLAQLVTDHVLGHEDGDELVPVIDTEGQADELQEDRRATRPRLDDLVASAASCLLCLLQQIAVDERPFPCRARHSRSPLLRATTDDEAIRRLVVPGLVALGALAPRRNRMPTARGAAFAAAVRMVDRVHRHATDHRALAEPAIAAGLADRNILTIRIGDRADRRHAL